MSASTTVNNLFVTTKGSDIPLSPEDTARAAFSETIGLQQELIEKFTEGEQFTILGREIDPTSTGGLLQLELVSDLIGIGLSVVSQILQQFKTIEDQSAAALK
jgi:hypothetical protein